MKFINFKEIGSTNEYVRRNLRVKEFEVVVAEKQTNDRVKRGNLWISDKGGALFSFWTEDKYELQDKIEMFSCYVVSEVLKEYIKESSEKTSEDEREHLKFKWPNDIYYKDEKISSVFCDKVRDRIIIGIRINVNNDVEKIDAKATSLSKIFKRKYPIEEIIEKIVLLFEKKVKLLVKEWEEILLILNNDNYLKDKKIKIEKNGKYTEKEYRFSRVDRAGKLLIIGKGDADETKCQTLKFKLIEN